MMEGNKSRKVKKTRTRKKPYYIPSTKVEDVTKAVHDGNTLRFILYHFPAAYKDVAYTKYGNEMSEKGDMLYTRKAESSLIGCFTSP